jgi:hypothetical protein
MKVFSKTLTAQVAGLKKSDLIKKGFQYCRVGYDNTYPLVHVDHLENGIVNLPTSNVLGQEFTETQNIIGFKTSYWLGEVVKTVNIGDEIGECQHFVDIVRKKQKLDYLPKSYHLTQSGFVWEDEYNEMN